jgi:hypothetical protein
MVTLTPEQRQEIAKAGEEPLRIEDPETKTAYFLITEAVFRRLKPAVEIEQSDPSLFEFEEDIAAPRP